MGNALVEAPGLAGTGTPYASQLVRDPCLESACPFFAP